jgi:carboxypeptidase A2
MLFLALTTGGLALADGNGMRVRYDDHRVVRAFLTTQAELDLMLELSPDCWCEAPGIRTLDFRLPPESMPALEASGIEHQVLIENVQERVDAELARLAGPGTGGPGNPGDFYDDFRDLAAIVARMDDLADAHPDIVEVLDVGDSIEGRDILALRIGGAAMDKPTVVIDATQHAREWIAPMVAMYIAETLVEAYATDPQITALVDALELFVIPVVNPDGYVYSWDVERYWRKNRRDNGDGTFGVDLNRNWGFEWGGAGSSGDPGDPLYRGTAPFSEPETAALRDFYEAYPTVVSSIDFHSYGLQVLSPFGYAFGGPDDGGAHAIIGQTMGNAIQSVFDMMYEVGPFADVLYEAAGASIDWTWGERGIVSYTIELRGDDFVLPPGEIVPTAQENLAAALAMAQFAVDGVLFDFGGGGPPTVLDAGETTTLALSVMPHSSGPLDVDSARLYERNDTGPFSDVPLVHLGGSTYEATLSPAPCGASVEFYVAIRSELGVVYRSPAAAPAEVHEATAYDVTVAFHDDFEAGAGWTVESVDLADGQWEIGVPAGGGDRGDPPTDYDGSGACAVTDNEDGNSDVDGGPTRLVSGVIDLSGAHDPTLRYARWFTDDLPGDEDRLDVEVSDDGGGTWTLVDSTGPLPGWEESSVRLADHVSLTSSVVVRFSVADNPNDSVTEAAVDAVEIYDVGCGGGTGDLDGDGDVDFQDLLALLNAWGPCGACDEDLDADGDVDFADLLILLAAWLE